MCFLQGVGVFALFYGCFFVKYCNRYFNLFFLLF